jgi:hypothetical protein
VLRELYFGRQTGLLYIDRAPDRVSFRFVNGEVVSGASTGEKGRLGETMVRYGLLTRPDLERALVVVKRESRRLGPVLRELGILEAPRLEQALGLHIREMLLTTLQWDEASHVFQPEELPELHSEDLTLRSSTGELILELVRSISSLDTVREGLGDIDQPLVAVPDPPFRLERITLTPADGYVLSRVDGKATARTIIEITPLPVEEVERSLLGLLCTGVIEYRRLAAGANEPRREVAAAPAPRPVATPGPEAEAELRNEVEQAYQSLDKKDHFQVLGLEKGASPRHVKEAYARLVKRFDPDAHPSASFVVKAKMETVYTRVCEAHEALCRTPDARARASAGPAPKAQPVMTPEFQKAVERAYEEFQGKNHFQVLGLLRTASVSDVTDAHARQVRRFPPEMLPACPPELREKMQAVLNRLRDAQQALGTPEGLENHRASLRTASPSPVVPLKTAASHDPSATMAPSDGHTPQATDSESVSRIITTAETDLAEGRPWDALAALEAVASFAQGPLERKVRLLLARGHQMTPDGARKAEGELLKLVQKNPKDAEALLALGRFYKAKALTNRARAMFQKIVELEPGHKAAAAELASLRADVGSDGLLNRLRRQAG